MAVRPPIRQYEFYIRTTAEIGTAVEHVADTLGMSRSEVGNEAILLWLSARGAELAAVKK